MCIILAILRGGVSIINPVLNVCTIDSIGDRIMGNTTSIQLRNDSAANWTTDNPILAQGEMGLETDTNRMKFGDGTTAWNSLPYVGTGASFKYGLYTLSALQTSNISVGNHIEWDTSQGSLGGLSTGSGQAKGIVTLSASKTYKITGAMNFSHVSSGTTAVRVYDRTNSTYLGITLKSLSVNYSSNYSEQPSFLAIVEAETDIDVDVRFTQTTNTAEVINVYSWLLIEEYGGY